MKLRTRYTLIISLMATFTIVAPLILLHASGYRYNFKKNIVEKTGIIYVNSEPPEAQVFVNGQWINEPAPVSVTRLLPEEYDIEIKLDGYLPWRKTLTVESGQTTFAKGVNLIKDTLPKLMIRHDITDSVFSQDGTTAVFVSSDDEWSDLMRYDFGTERTLSLAKFAADKYSRLELNMSPDGTQLLVNGKLKIDGNISVTLYDTDLTEASFEIPELAAATDMQYCWSDDSSLLIATPDKLSSVSEDRTIQTIFIAGQDAIKDVFCTSSYYWLLIDAEEGLQLTRLDKNNPTLPETIATLTHRHRRFVDGKDDLLWLSGDSQIGGLAINPQTGHSFRTPEVTKINWEFSDGNGRVLLSNDFEIFLIDFVRPEPELITRLGTPIESVAWHPNGSYALFATSTGITAIELDNRDRRNIFRLVEFGTVETMSVNRESNLIRFVGSIGNQRGIYERP
ncbi:MAG: PEGA domain-containing protein [Patescibacteria group bacterium]